MCFSGKSEQYKNFKLIYNSISKDRDTKFDFSSGNKKFDKYFKTKKAPKDIQDYIIGNHKFFEIFLKLKSFRMKGMSVYEEQLYITYRGPGFARNYGPYKNNDNMVPTVTYCYIPAKYLREILPVIVEWMDSMMKNQSK